MRQSEEERNLAPGFGAVIGPDGRPIPVSPALLAAGTVTMTAAMHALFVAAWVHFQATNLRELQEDHPEHAGYGRDLIGLYERYKDDLPGLDRALAAERAQQRAELSWSARRVADLLRKHAQALKLGIEHLGSDRIWVCISTPSRGRRSIAGR